MDSGPFCSVEISSFGEIKYFFNQNIVILPHNSDKTFYFKIQIQVEELSKSIVLFFNERITVKDAIPLITRALFQGVNEEQFSLILSNGNIIPKNRQISYYLNSNIHSNDKEEDEIVKVTLVRTESCAEADNDIPRKEPKDSNVEEEKITTSPNPKRVTRSHSLSKIKAYDSDPLQNLSNSSENLQKIIEPLQNRYLRKFYILFPSNKKRSTYVKLFLDMQQTVQQNLEKVLDYANFNFDISDFGFYCPTSHTNELVVGATEVINEEEKLEEDDSGFWLQKDLTLSESLSQNISQTILEVRAYSSPKCATISFLDSKSNYNDQFSITQIKYRDHLDTSIILVTPNITVSMATKQLLLDITNRSISETSLFHKTSSSSNFNRDYRNYRLYNSTKSIYLEDSLNLFTYIKSNSILRLDLWNIKDNPIQETVQDYGQINSVIYNTNNQKDLSTEETLAEKEVWEAFAKFEGSYMKPELISGEFIRKSFLNILCFIPRIGKTKGSVFITNYQLWFLSNDRSTYFSKTADFYIPLTTILKVTEIGEGELCGIQIACKDLRIITFGLEGNNNNSNNNNAKQTKMLLSVISQSPPFSKLFALSNKELSLSQPYYQLNGWDLYSPLNEYQRLGLSSINGWRITNVNKDYSFCDTYPSCFVVPDKIDDETLWKISQFRSKGRVLATVWRHPNNGATITRCSQPRVGFFKKSRCESDEKLVYEIRELNQHNKKFIYLLDSRPIANAKANHLRKGGHESTSIYTGCKLMFLNIANIHFVYDSFTKLTEICQYNANQERWLSSLESTNWFQIISSVLAAAVKIAVFVDKRNASIITHCSDGWDRTPQISALSQFLMDPYYRTMYGFAILIEKEWCSFGHRFSTRSGHLGNSLEEICPIFLVFIDCIYQMIVQFPCSIEFNEEFLLFIIEHVYSCRYGTFLCDSEKEATEKKINEKTISLWTIINEKRDEYLNVYYRMNSQVLYPSCSIRKLQIWSAYYLRFITSQHPKEFTQSVTKPAFQELISLRKHIKLYQSNSSSSSSL